MRYEMSQAELIEAVEFYLNEKVLKRPVSVSAVKRRTDTGSLDKSVLHVTVEDTQEHIADQHKAAAREAA